MAVSQTVDAITVNSVAAMVALKHVRDGQLVRTRGYYAVGDGGGNEYTFKATAGTADGGFVIDRTLGGSFFANDTTVANALQFGAVGNGVGDDSSAVQAALNTGADVVLARHNLESTVTMSTAGQVLSGGTLLEAGPTLSPMVLVSSQYCTIKGVSFEGTETLSSWNTLGAWSSADLNRSAVRTTANFTNITECRFKGKSAGIQASGSECNITNNQFAGLFSSAPDGGQNYHSMVSLTGERYIVSHNQARYAGSFTLLGSSVQNSLIASNRINFMHDNGIYISSGHYCVVTDNTVEDIYGSTGIKTRGASNIVSNNTVSRAPLGISVTGNGSTSRTSEFNDSILLNFSSGSIKPDNYATLTGATSGATGRVSAVFLMSGSWSGGDAAGHIYLSQVTGTFSEEDIDTASDSNVLTRLLSPYNGSGNAVVGNIVSDCTSYGIRLSEQDGLYPNNCVVSSNTVKDSSAQDTAAIEVYGANHSVSNNAIEGTDELSLGAISLVNAPNANVTGNTTTGGSGLRVSSSPGSLVSGNSFSGAYSIKTVLNSAGTEIKGNSLFGRVVIEQLDIVFSDNQCSGLVFIDPASNPGYSYLTARNNAITAQGNALYILIAEGGSLETVDLSGTHAISQGGTSTSAYALLFTGSSTPVSIKRLLINDCYFYGNNNSGGLGPVRIQGGANLVIGEMTMANTKIWSPVEMPVNIAVDASGSAAFSKCRIYHNRNSTTEDIVSLSGFTDITFDQCVFGDTNNSDSVYLNNTGSVRISDCTMRNVQKGGFDFGSNVTDVYVSGMKYDGTATVMTIGAASGYLHLDTNINLVEKSSDPANPPEGKSVFWQSDGTGTGTDGTINVKVTAGAVTTTYVDILGSTVASLRKQIQDTITFSGTPAFDFDTGTGDNKAMTLTADVTDPTLSATRVGDYNLVLIQDGTGGWEFPFPTNVLGNPVIDETPNSVSVYRLYFDGSNFHV